MERRLNVVILFIVVILLGCQKLPPGVDIEQYRNQFVEGVVEVDENLKDKIPEGKKYLIISLSDPNVPMPIAVLNVEDPELPYKFRISEKHKIDETRMIRGMLILKARLSKSKFAESQKGDLVGQVNVIAGTKGVRVVLNQIIR